MKRLLNQLIITALSLGAFTQTFGALGSKSLDTTASTLYFFDHPRAELNAQTTKEAVRNIKEELSNLLNAQVVTAKHDEFFLPVMFEYGVLNVRLTDAAMIQLQSAFDSKGELDVSGSIGIPNLDALNRKWNLTKYAKRPLSIYLTLQFDVGTNPLLVADSFQAAAEVKWAEPNQLRFIGGGTSVRRIAEATQERNRVPTIYVLNLGWGDCPAGCLANHRRYFEVSNGSGGLQMTSIGEAGTPLPADMRAEYYK